MTTTFSNAIKVRGSNQTKWNVDRDGAPFGAIWTFSGKGEEHPYHAKTLADEYATFITLRGAKAFMAGQAKSL